MVNHESVSIVIPTRDRPHLLGLTLRSVLAQEDVDLEILLVDDGTMSRAAALVEQFGDPRIRLLRSRGPHGVSHARNRGIAAARRDWVAFCDDDDLWAPDKLALQLRAAAETGRTWVYAGDVSIGPDLRVLSGGPPHGPEELTHDLPRRNAMPAGASNVVVRRDMLSCAGSFDPALRATEDWDLWLRLTRVAGPPACVCRPLVAYRFHPLNIRSDADRLVDETRMLARRYRLAVDLAAVHRRAAWAALRSGRRAEAVRHYARAVGHGDVMSVARIGYVLTRRRIAGEALFASLPSDDAWIAEAERWLASFRTPTVACPSSGEEEHRL